MLDKLIKRYKEELQGRTFTVSRRGRTYMFGEITPRGIIIIKWWYVDDKTRHQMDYNVVKVFQNVTNGTWVLIK